MNPNRLLQQNRLLKQQNNFLNILVQSMHNELQANKVLTQSDERAILAEKKLSESSLVEKELAEHKKQLSSATERAVLVEKELAEHKKQLSSATERARLADKKLSEYSLVEKLSEVKYSPPLHITRTRRHLAKMDDTLYENKFTERMDDVLHDELKFLQFTDMEVTR